MKCSASYINVLGVSIGDVEDEEEQGKDDAK